MVQPATLSECERTLQLLQISLNACQTTADRRWIYRKTGEVLRVRGQLKAASVKSSG